MKSQEKRIGQIKDRCMALIKSATDSGQVRQEDIAKDLGIGDSAFRQYSSGRTAVPLQHLEAFCEYMGVSIEYLITGRNNSPILEAYYSLDEDEKRIADKVLGIKRHGLQKKMGHEFGVEDSVHNSNSGPAHGKRHK